MTLVSPGAPGLERGAWHHLPAMEHRSERNILLERWRRDSPTTLEDRSQTY